jgi:hypothetical protein
MRHGVGQWFMGTIPPYMIASALFRMTRPPVFAGGLAMLWGYAKGMFTGMSRYQDAEFRRFLRRYQWLCLVGGKDWATRQIDQRQAAHWQGGQLPSVSPSPAGP